MQLSLLDQHSLFACELSLVLRVIHECINDRLDVIVYGYHFNALTEHVVRLSRHSSLHQRILQPVYSRHSGDLVDGRLGELTIHRRVSDALIAHVIQSQLQLSNTLLQQLVVAMLGESHVSVQLDSLTEIVQLPTAQPIGYLQERMILVHCHSDAS